jgi:hypothetical protein
MRFMSGGKWLGNQGEFTLTLTASAALRHKRLPGNSERPTFTHLNAANEAAQHHEVSPL